MRYIASLVGLVICFPNLFAATNVQFTADDVCEGSQTILVSTSTTTIGSITQYLWDLDNDGQFDDATGNTVNHLFGVANTYQVGLKIVVSNGDRDSSYQSVVINPIANADFTWSEVCDGIGMPFADNSTIASGSIVSWEWEFTNDNMYDDATGASVPYTFPTHGTYNVGLRVTSDSGCVSIVNKNVLVNPNPTADFTFTNECIGDSTELDATASVVTGSISSYNWELNGDNMYNDASGQSINHEFINWGNYQVGLRVTTNKGCNAVVTHLVTVAPIPYVSFDFDSSCVGLSVAFNNQSFSPVGTMSYDWDFGDGDTSDLEDPNHIFDAAGGFNVTLIGTSNYGCADTVVESITIYPTPQADFNYIDVCFGQTTAFTNTSKPLGSSIEGYQWFFGDGGQDFVNNPTHTYTSADSFDVSLVVYSTDGCRDTLTQTVNVWPLPNAEIVPNWSLNFCDGDSVGLFVDPEDDESVLWSTSDDGNSIWVHTSGLYHVLFYDDNGCKDRDTVEVVVYELPTLVTNNDTTVGLGFEVPMEVTGASTYEWTPADYLDDPYSSTPMSDPLETITYTVIGTDQYGCVDSTTVTITVDANYDFVTYNLFSPNGDNVNDFWEVKNIDLYPDCEVIVYNRLGSKVFEKKGYTNDWDGTFEGNPLPDATYYYVISCDGTDRLYKGPISILR